MEIALAPRIAVDPALATRMPAAFVQLVQGLRAGTVRRKNLTPSSRILAPFSKRQ
jgi:hypothetical protein